ncbi:MAG: [protein-PII] uridylyltransferase [Alphaproteobacteria bacterium]|nr:[protein-PII] uridylyltransferase [Alphaproteobacteria bacterium]
MIRLSKRREIVDRAAVAEAAHAAVDAAKNDAAAQRALLGVYRAALEAGRAVVRGRFEIDQNGTQAAAGNCFLMDQLIRIMYDVAVTRFYRVANPTAGEQLAIVAVGGYGRGELAPGSDIDLLFVLPYKSTPHSEQVVEHILYLLWDMGLKVGHATRSVDECIRQARADMTIRTGILEARYIWGTKALFTELRKRFLKDIVAGTGPEFVEAKLRERDERHLRMGDSRYVLEPNIKDGKGGLRDLQTLYWIGKYLYQVDEVDQLVERGVLHKAEAARFNKAHDYLWTLRCHLHYLTGRPDERLTFDVQPELAARMGYADRAGVQGVERFMRHYFLVAKDIGDLTRIYCAALEERHQRRRRFRIPGIAMFNRELEGFPLEGDRLTVPDKNHFRDHPVDLLRLFAVAQKHDVDIHPDALYRLTQNLNRIDRKLREDPEANRIFMDILTSPKDPEVTLRHMNEAGVFGKFIPDFGRVVAQMQYDMYHVYTTDEHTIFAIGILHRIEAGMLGEELPLATGIIGQVQSRAVLYVAVLLHDIAKGRGGDHSLLGADVARKLCPRLGFTPEQTETVAWLVEHHLAMSRTAFKRDLNDPKTVSDFAELVQSPERLRLLLCLTVADIRAVGPRVWNGWKASLLREIYSLTEERLSGASATDIRDARAERAKHALREALAEWPGDELERHLARGHPRYWLAFDTETLARHARLARDADAAEHPLTVDTEVDSYHAVTEVTVYTPDHPGLFSRITGALSLSGANIVGARINTFNDGMALDVFQVQDAEGGAFDRPDKLARLSACIEQSLGGKLRPDLELAAPAAIPSRTRVFYVPPRVLIDNTASRTYTVIEVNGRDRPGLLYDMTRALSDLGLQIASAKIFTYGARVVDVFYVRDVFGMKVEHEAKHKQLRKALMPILDKANPKVDTGRQAAAAE